METNNNKISYETLWKFIIRPPKDEYDEDLLGNIIFTYKHKQYQRKDYDLISSEGYIMKCSFVEPVDAFRPTIEMPIVLYLHGNSSSRLEGLNNLEILLNHNINLFVIDFPGCGLSEGEYISLGYHEKDDVKILVDFIENLPGVGKIGLWGRSMGAATTLLYANTDPRISAICVDSPFEDFKKLAEELVVKQIKLPKFIIDGALKIVQGTVKKKNGLDIYKLRPIDKVSTTYQPALFIHAINDELINIEHSINLFNNYGGPKSLKCCDKGGHRPCAHRPQLLLRPVLPGTGGGGGLLGPGLLPGGGDLRPQRVLSEHQPPDAPGGAGPILQGRQPERGRHRPLRRGPPAPGGHGGGIPG